MMPPDSLEKASPSMTLLNPQPPPPHPMASAPMSRDESDYDSSCSSSAAGGRGSRRSWISDVSFSSSSSVSLRSFGSDTAGLRRSVDYYKPHKANQAEWEAIRRVQAADGRVCLDHFRLVRRLGSGDIGNVYLCRLREPGLYWSSASGGGGGCAYAMKVVDREALAVRKKLQRAEAEREILAMLDHPFLPTLYASFEASHYSCLVMEFCPGGDLHALRQRQPGRRFSVSSAKFYVAEILLALEYLHMMGIVYRDLKPENVLVRADGHIMLSDFDLSFKCDVVPRLLRPQAAKRLPGGKHPPSCVPPPMQPVLSCLYGGEKGCARKARDEEDQAPAAGGAGAGSPAEPEPELVAEPVTARSRSFVGTHEYLAPEVISGAGHGSAVDWWTLGVFLYELLFGQTPFKGDNNEKTLINILKQPLRFPRLAANGKDWEDMARAQDLICRLLVKNPKRRVGSSKGSTEIKRHEFFKGVNWALIRSVRPPEVPRDPHRAKAKAAPTSSVAAAAQKSAATSKKETPADFYHNVVLQHFDYF